MSKFEWDENKNTENKIKHGVSFEEGYTAFGDEFGLYADDPDSFEEERFLLLGLSAKLNLLVVVHCYRKNEEVIRIISCRKANRLETAEYNKNRGENYERPLRLH